MAPEIRDSYRDGGRRLSYHDAGRRFCCADAVKRSGLPATTFEFVLNEALNLEPIHEVVESDESVVILLSA
jgi:hypothetical protein